MHKGAIRQQIRNFNGLIAGSFVRQFGLRRRRGKSKEIGSMGPVPKAQCGPSSRTERGFQGQTTSQERASGDSKLGYNCNLELVGQFRGEGAFFAERAVILWSLRLHGNGK